MVDERPKGWIWNHEHQNHLIAQHGWMCEAHPGTPFPHDDCPGPGEPWAIEGKEDIRELLEDAYVDGVMNEDPLWRIAWFRERAR
jgi:hypothetical protein